MALNRANFKGRKKLSDKYQKSKGYGLEFRPEKDVEYQIAIIPLMDMEGNTFPNPDADLVDTVRVHQQVGKDKKQSVLCASSFGARCQVCEIAKGRITTRAVHTVVLLKERKTEAGSKFIPVSLPMSFNCPLQELGDGYIDCIMNEDFPANDDIRKLAIFKYFVTGEKIDTEHKLTIRPSGFIFDVATLRRIRKDDNGKVVYDPQADKDELVFKTKTELMTELSLPAVERLSCPYENQQLAAARGFDAYEKKDKLERILRKNEIIGGENE